MTIRPTAADASEGEDPVTKKEIVRQIADKLEMTQLKTKEIVQLTFDAIVDTLLEVGRIELRNFGVFEVKQRKPRKARNPRTGERVDVEAKNVVTFQPGKEMEEKVRKFAKAIEPKRKSRRGAKAAHAAQGVGLSHNGANVTGSPEPVGAG